jgi:peptide subunit release factor RF-3
MAVRQRRYSKEEIFKRGQAIYEAQIKQQVETDNYGKIVAIDIETGAFVIADTVLLATNQLFERCPTAQPWIIRIGYRAVYHFGARSLIQKL